MIKFIVVIDILEIFVFCEFTAIKIVCKMDLIIKAEYTSAIALRIPTNPLSQNLSVEVNAYIIKEI